MRAANVGGINVCKRLLMWVTRFREVAFSSTVGCP
jgi:hypothetical protein